ncbi:glycosyltransferase [Bacillus gobiensis]|uniref:MGDG synthase family glycosyltransferase n=1 Tax=Bacillus gobiensis TaxID=1441095 RepID=UPI003D22C76E
MKKVLLLPFLQISSGHHQVADALAEYIYRLDQTISCKKIDILHYTYGRGERLISNLYLYAIQRIPRFYSWLYKTNAYKTAARDKTYYFYEMLFLRSMKELVEREKPDLIICSHSLPSYLLNLLKKKNVLNVPVINAYTDFFINNVWGIQSIDHHFVPSLDCKQILEKLGVKPEKITVSGIPIHPEISIAKKENEKPTYNVLIAGGSLGVGPIEKLLKQKNHKINFFVLCGKNIQLYNKIKQLKSELITPVRYIQDRNEMNDLYDQMDLILTKPGGITISECLRKQIPVFLYYGLPGQEEINKAYLESNGLVIKLNDGDQLEETILKFLEDEKGREEHLKRVTAHIHTFEDFTSVIQSYLL